MAPQVTSTDGAGPLGMLGVLGDRVNERTKRLISWWLLGEAAWKAGRAVHARWNAGRRYTVSIGGSDDLYPDVHAWLLASIPETQRRSLAVEYRVPSGGDDAASTSGGSPRRDRRRLTVAYDGKVEQTVTIDGYTITVAVRERDRKQRPGRRDDSGGSYREYLRSLEEITFTSPTAAGRDAVLSMLQRLADRRAATDRPPTFRVADRWGGWSDRDELRRRTLDTVILAEGQKERIVADLDRFLSEEAEYGRIGVPWHRGYLFEGPPGTGKSSLAIALANHFGLDIYYVPLSSIEDDAQLLGFFASVQPRSILLLEDVDVAAATRDRDDSGRGVTMSGLLNALDGVATPHGLVTVLTTNQVEVLDAALIRPGRIDLREHIGLLDEDQFCRLVHTLTGIHIPAKLDGGFRPVAPAEVVEVVKRTLRDTPADRHAELVQFTR